MKPNQPRVHRAIVAGELSHDSRPIVANGGKVVCGHSVFSRQGYVAARILADSLNLLCRKAAAVMLFAVPKSALVSCVKRIGLLPCWREMPWINTRRIVAGVHQNKSFRDRSAKDRVTVAVRKNVFSIQRNHSVAGLCLAGRPYPASVCFLDAIHESFIGAYLWKLIQFSGIPSAVVAIFAQLSAVGRFPTLQAWRFDSLVSHITSFVCNYNIKQGVMR